MDKLGDGRIDDGFGSWLTFFGGGNDVFDATLLARYIVFSNDCFLLMGSDNFGLDKFKQASFNE